MCSRTLRAEVYLDEKLSAGLYSGAYVPLGVVVKERNGVTLVPAAALVESPDRAPYVFLVDGDRIRAQPRKVLVTTWSPGATPSTANSSPRPGSCSRSA